MRRGNHLKSGFLDDHDNLLLAPSPEPYEEKLLAQYGRSLVHSLEHSSQNGKDQQPVAYGPGFHNVIFCGAGGRCEGLNAQDAPDPTCRTFIAGALPSLSCPM